jgi:hypothetical protein
MTSSARLLVVAGIGDMTGSISASKKVHVGGRSRGIGPRKLERHPPVQEDGASEHHNRQGVRKSGRSLGEVGLNGERLRTQVM